jgi:hypothetical protein
MRWLLVAAIFLTTFPAIADADEYHVKCDLEIAIPASDKDAIEWLNSRKLRSLEVILTMDPLAIVEPPENDLFWGTRTIRATRKELIIEWQVKANPITRRPRVHLTVNRFSGEADLVYLMLQKDGHGPEYLYGSLTGRCEINSRKL